MKIVFMGTPIFAVAPLRALLASDHKVQAVVTQPDRPVGRGRKIATPPVKDLALEHHLPVLQPEKIRKSNFDQVLAFYEPDIIVVVAYGKIIPPEILTLPRYGCINIHGSILPKYRGAAPVQWAIINGERETGVTIMQLDAGMDTGNIIAVEKIEILDDDDTASVLNMLSVAGSQLMLKVLDDIEAKGRVDSTPQDNAQATMAPILNKKDGLIDWNMTNEQIICRIQGLQPWPTAFSFLHGAAWKFLRAEPFLDKTGLIFPPPAPGKPEEFDPGMVSAIIKGRGFTVRTGDGHLLVKEVQPHSKKTMAASDAINGKLIRSGDEFISDPNFLEGTNQVE